MSENQATTESTEVVETPEEVKTEETTESKGSETTETPEEKKADELPKGVQKRLGKLTARNYELQAEIDRLKAETQSETETPTEEDSDQEYISKKDLPKYLDELQSKNAEKATQKEKSEKLATAYKERIEKFSESHPDFEEKLYSVDAKLPEDVGREIFLSEKSAELMYHFLNNPADAQKVYDMTPRRQMAYITQLEDNLSQPKETSKASKPISTESGTPTGSSDLSKMSIDDFIKQRNKKDGL